MSDTPEKIRQSLTVENVVASSELNTEIEIQTLVEDLPNSRESVDNFPGVIYESKGPKATILLFRSGKVVVTGAGSTDKSVEAAEKFYEELRDLGLEFDPEPTEVQNIVGSASLESKLNLNAAAIGLGLENVEYEPEHFPALIYHMEDLDIAGLIFGSGSIILSGATDVSTMRSAMDQIYAELKGLGLVGE